MEPLYENIQAPHPQQEALHFQIVAPFNRFYFFLDKSVGNFVENVYLCT